MSLFFIFKFGVNEPFGSRNCEDGNIELDQTMGHLGVQNAL